MKRSTMELTPLTPLKKTSTSDASTAGGAIPLTPTIRLSEPPAPHHVDYHHDPARMEGVVNPAFVGDQEPMFSKSFGIRANGMNGETKAPAHDSTTDDNGSVFSASIDPSNSLGNDIIRNGVSNGVSNGSGRIRHNTMSLTDMLMPPNYSTQKRHSLPTNGTVSLSEHEAQSLCTDGGSISFLGSSCASIMSQVPSSVKGLSSPWQKWFGRKSSDGSVVSTISDGSINSNSFDPDTISTQSKQRLQDLVKSAARMVRRQNKVGPAPAAPKSLLAPPAKPVKQGDDDKGSGYIRKRLDSFAPSSLMDQDDLGRLRGLSMKKFAWRSLRPHAIDPTGSSWLMWLFIVSMTLIYNAVVITLRGIFSYVQGGDDAMPIISGTPNVPAALNTMFKHVDTSLQPIYRSFWLTWLFIVSMTFIYNAVVITLRGIFSYVQGGDDAMPIISGTPNVPAAWLFFDYLCDFIYVVDMCMRAHLGYFHAGQIVKEFPLTRRKYRKSTTFWYDLFSLLPLELFYILVGGVQPLFRIPRLLKVHVYMEFASKFENKIRMAFVFRTVKMVGYLLYMIHLNTCCYFGMARIYGVNSTQWQFDGIGDPYVRCLYRATKTLMTIGNLPAPTTTPEIIFMTLDFMTGIFVFATIIGQMRDIVSSAMATRENFRERMDSTMTIMKNWKIPPNVQKRVNQWFVHRLDKGELVDEQTLLQAIPVKMQTDMAIHVHMDTLSKVNLFQDCDKMLLRELVLQLRPVLYLPGDYICKKGEVGKEMYIIKHGQVQVLGGGDGKKVLATLHAGSVFGEISLLSLGAGNRRTADVYSPGYSDLFVLDKKVLHDAIVSYPDAQEILKKKAREILKQNEESGQPKKKRRGKSLIAESILTKNPDNTPSKFFEAVLEVARSKHISATILRGSFEKSLDEEKEPDFVQYSSSDISGDEFFPVPRRSIRRKKKLQRSANVSPSYSNRDSGSDRRSDADIQEPTIVVHPSPHQSPPGSPGAGNKIALGKKLLAPTKGSPSKQTRDTDKKTGGAIEAVDTGSSVDPELPNAVPMSDGRGDRKVRRKIALAILGPSQSENREENQENEHDPGDFHFSQDILRASPNVSFKKMESCEEVRSEQAADGRTWPSLPQRPSILYSGGDGNKNISFEEYKAAHTAYDIVDLDETRAGTQKRTQRTSKTRNTSDESIIGNTETALKDRERTPSSSPRKKHRKNKSGNKSKKGK